MVAAKFVNIKMASINWNEFLLEHVCRKCEERGNQGLVALCSEKLIYVHCTYRASNILELLEIINLRNSSTYIICI